MKVLLVLLSVFFPFYLFSNQSDSIPLQLYGAVDTTSLRSLFIPSLYLSGSVGVSYGELGFSIPVTYIADGTGGHEQLIDMGVHLTIFPFSSGLFYSVSLIEMVVFVGPYTPSSRVNSINEMTLGYEITLIGGLSIVPRIRARDLSGSFTEELEYIRGFIPGFSRFDAAVEIRYSVASFDIDSGRKEEE